MHSRRTVCRVCGSNQLRVFLSLGPMPLANSFPGSPEEFGREPSYPLDVCFCDSCSLVQILDVIDPGVLFRNYIYVSGTSETMASHNAMYAATVMDFANLGPEDLVVEVASNDGSLLKRFQEYGVRTLGVEPATNIASLAAAEGIETVNQFFDETVAEALRARYGPARAVIANNVLAHVNETRDFLTGCKILLDNGLLVVEVPYLLELIEGLEFDTIYHEHQCYFSATTLMRLCDEVGLSVVRLDRVPTHGGSLRIYAGRREHFPGHSGEILALVDLERGAGLHDFSRYVRFASDVDANGEALVGLLRAHKDDGKTLAAYGAPAKGNTLLNYYGIGTELISFTVDMNPMKVGRYTPGMHIPVLPTSKLLDCQPDFVLILAWNFAEEIMRQQRRFSERGGHFILPVPDPKVV